MAGLTEKGIDGGLKVQIIETTGNLKGNELKSFRVEMSIGALIPLNYIV
jgi:hypothetical protein